MYWRSAIGRRPQLTTVGVPVGRDTVIGTLRTVDATGTGRRHRGRCGIHHRYYRYQCTTAFSSVLKDWRDVPPSGATRTRSQIIVSGNVVLLSFCLPADASILRFSSASQNTFDMNLICDIPDQCRSTRSIRYAFLVGPAAASFLVDVADDITS